MNHIMLLVGNHQQFICEKPKSPGKEIITIWYVTYPLPKTATFESMILRTSRLVGYVMVPLEGT